MVLQAHLDMVPQKNEEIEHDFEKDPINAYVDGEWVTADQTTLGADNGIGVAAAMAILQADDIQHPPVEALFTIDEETGMTGASGLKPDTLQGDILINMDSEDEGELYIGCAGGIDTNLTFSYTKEKCPEDYQAYKLTVRKLKGGHSGLDIALGRGNAIKLLNRYLWHAKREHSMLVSKFNGGGMRNAIPREASALVVIPKSEKNNFLKCQKLFAETFKAEFSVTEPDLQFVAEEADLPETVIDHKTLTQLVNAIYGCPHGVVRMSDIMPDVVETSTNLATIEMDDKEIRLATLQRSSVDSAKDDLANMIRSVFELADATIENSGAYPGWKPNDQSDILKVMKKAYKDRFGKTPEVKVIHAGLECAILGGSYPNWDMISFGPTIRYPHSPDEKVNIETVQKFWDFLVETLKQIPKK